MYKIEIEAGRVMWKAIRNSVATLNFNYGAGTIQMTEGSGFLSRPFYIQSDNYGAIMQLQTWLERYANDES